MSEPSPDSSFTVVVGALLSEPHRALLAERFPEVRFVYTPHDRFPDHLAEADALIAWQLTPEQLAAAPRLKWLQTISAGVDMVDMEAVRSRGVALTNSSGIHVSNIAEHVLAMMLAFARNLPFLFRAQVAHEWRDSAGRQGIFEIGGQTLMIVGLGKIGEALAQRASALGMRVIGVRSRPERSTASTAAEVISLAELPERLGEADHVALCLPGTRDTTGLFNAAMIGRLKPGAFIYNIGRGTAIDQAALIRALQEKQIAGAGLDVTDPEPLPADSPLWDMEQVILTDHTAGASPYLMDRAVPLWAENLRRFLAGEPLRNVVDLDRGY